MEADENEADENEVFTVVALEERPYGLLVDGDYVYYAAGLEPREGSVMSRGGGLYRVLLEGGDPEHLLTVPAHVGSWMPLAIVDGRLYFWNLTAVSSMPCEGVPEEVTKDGDEVVGVSYPPGADLVQEHDTQPVVSLCGGLVDEDDADCLLIVDRHCVYWGRDRNYDQWYEPMPYSQHGLDYANLEAAIDRADGSVYLSARLDDSEGLCQASLSWRNAETGEWLVIAYNQGPNARAHEDVATWQLFETEVGVFAQCLLGAQAWRTPEALRPIVYRVEGRVEGAVFEPALEFPVTAFTADEEHYYYAQLEDEVATVWRVEPGGDEPELLLELEGMVTKLALGGNWLVILVETDEGATILQRRVYVSDVT
jgi:hypothetical protein